MILLIVLIAGILDFYFAHAQSTTTKAAQTAAPAGNQSVDWIDIGSGTILFLVILGGLAAVWHYTRKATLTKIDPGKDEPTFTLDELRQLRDKGQLSQEEFLRARAIVVEKERQRLAEGSGDDKNGASDK